MISRVNTSCVRVVFDGHDITSRWLVTGIERPAPSYSASMDDNPSGGSFLMGVRSEAAEVSFSVHITGDSSERREQLRELASWLAVDGARELSFSDDLGLLYMAAPNGQGDVEHRYWRDIVTLTFAVPEPVMLGEVRTLAVPSGSSASTYVGGTAPALPVVEAPAAVRDGTTHEWGVRLDGGDMLRVGIPVTGGVPVIIDCAERTATVNGSAALVTLDSDWFRLAPGRHTVAQDEGSGRCTLTWRERWFI